MLLQFQSGELRQGRVIYTRDEFALEYTSERSPSHSIRKAAIERALGIPQPRWFAIAGSLSIVFAGPRLELVAFDAYTNISKWIPLPDIPLPPVSGTGSLSVLPQGSEGDRTDLGVTPTFWYSAIQARLRIALGSAATEHYQISTCLIVGIGPVGLVSLDLTELALK